MKAKVKWPPFLSISQELPGLDEAQWGPQMPQGPQVLPCVYVRAWRGGAGSPEDGRQGRPATHRSHGHPSSRSQGPWQWGDLASSRRGRRHDSVISQEVQRQLLSQRRERKGAGQGPQPALRGGRMCLASPLASLCSLPPCASKGQLLA